MDLICSKIIENKNMSIIRKKKSDLDDLLSAELEVFLGEVILQTHHKYKMLFLFLTIATLGAK